MRKLVFQAALLACLTASPAAADPITYTGARSVGDGSANLSITTDGTVGVVRSENVLDWVITVSWKSGFTLRGPLSGNNSQVLIRGSELTATADELVFDFSGSSRSFLLFQNPVIGLGGPFYSVQTAGAGSFNEQDPSEGLRDRTRASYPFHEHTHSVRSGSVVLATSVPDPAPVPEPASMLLLGTGLIAACVRRWVFVR